ncbi:hypothetical protein DL96DRAFT_1774432 [Flagelloscypha sp. PMI_526]|nr:hypothetical protein DL96DRAFT_1774432 [Flagelloscypha sp. PMI_526]
MPSDKSEGKDQFRGTWFGGERRRHDFFSAIIVMLCDLPLEILELVFTHLEDDSSTLLACIRTNHSFCSIATPGLLSTVHLGYRPNMGLDDVDPPDNFLSFSECLKRSPTKAALVKHLALGNRILQRPREDIIPVAAQLQNIVSLACRGSKGTAWSEDQWPITKFLVTPGSWCSQIQVLTIECILDIPFIALGIACPLLNTLTLDYVTASEPPEKGIDLSNTRWPQIRSLTVVRYIARDFEDNTLMQLLDVSSTCLEELRFRGHPNTGFIYAMLGPFETRFANCLQTLHLGPDISALTQSRPRQLQTLQLSRFVDLRTLGITLECSREDPINSVLTCGAYLFHHLSTQLSNDAISLRLEKIIVEIVYIDMLTLDPALHDNWTSFDSLIASDRLPYMNLVIFDVPYSCANNKGVGKELRSLVRTWMPCASANGKLQVKSRN